MELSKVVFVIPNLHKYRELLFERLADNLDIIIFDGNDAGKKDISKALLSNRITIVPNKTLQFRFLSFTIKWQLGLLREIWSIPRNSKVVFQFHSGYINYWLAWVYLKLFRYSTIVWGGGIVRRDLGKTKNWVKHSLKYLIEKSADKVICYGPDYADYILSKGYKGEVVIALNFPNLLEVPHFNRNPYYDIVYVGQLSDLKRFHVLFDAIRILCSDPKNDLKVALVGRGKQFKIDIDNMTEVTHYETLWGRQLTELLSNSKIIVLPGIGGLSVVEGMMCGCFPITTNGDGTLHSLINKTGGYKVEFDTTVSDLVRIIQQALKRTDLNSLRHYVYQKCNREYDIIEIVKLWNKALQ